MVAHTRGGVSVTPTSREAETYVDEQLVGGTAMLQSGQTVRFGRHSVFRFCLPPPSGQEPPQQHSMQHSHRQVCSVHVNYALK